MEGQVNNLTVSEYTPVYVEMMLYQCYEAFVRDFLTSQGSVARHLETVDVLTVLRFPHDYVDQILHCLPFGAVLDVSLDADNVANDMGYMLDETETAELSMKN